MEKINEVKTGYEELFNHVVLGRDSQYVLYLGTTKCCATGTCDLTSFGC
jgi:hypothetical protein